MSLPRFGICDLGATNLVALNFFFFPDQHAISGQVNLTFCSARNRVSPK